MPQLIGGGFVFQENHVKIIGGGLGREPISLPRWVSNYAPREKSNSDKHRSSRIESLSVIDVLCTCTSH
jgi:hypothetical protein